MPPSLYHSNTPQLLSHIRSYIRRTESDWNYITPTQYREEYLKKRKKKHVLLDLRRNKDFEKFHVGGARNVFWMNVFSDNVLSDLPKDGTPIFLLCYVGHTASQVMTLLKLLGYNAIAIKYGYGVSPSEGVPVSGWLGLGYPVVYSG